MSPIRCCLTPRLLSWSWVSFLLVLLLSPLNTSAANLTGLSLTPPNPTLNINETLQLIATGILDDGTQQVLAQAKQVSAGSSHTCALSADGTIKCWGRNTEGQLGNGTTTDSTVPVLVSGVSNAVAISTTGTYDTDSSPPNAHSCAVLANGTIKCWGRNVFGQLGNGMTTDSTVPVTVSGISNAVGVSAGVYHSCAVLADGAVRCWGRNQGALGNGTTTNSSSPVAVSGFSNAVAVSVGVYYACAVLADRRIKCWGGNSYGQLGNGTTTYSLIPVTVSVINTAVAVSTGREHACAATVEGTVWCWGNNAQGQLGTGNYASSSIPIQISGINTALSVSGSSMHNCATLADGTLRCWGSSSYLGDGTGTYSLVPVTVSGINSAVAVSAAYAHTCAVLANGTLQCWGWNGFGQLGNGATISDPVKGISTAVNVSSGAGLSCTLLTDGTVRCWGSNYDGQLGNGTTTNSSAPVAVNGISSAVAVSAGGMGDAGQTHTCAMLADSTLRCWGNNIFGALGNGTTTNSSTPVTVSGINTAVDVSAGGTHSCAVLSDGTVRCWGGNLFFRVLGNDAFFRSTTPVTVAGITTAVAVSAGFYHSCAVLADGTLRCWGDNSFGMLGNGTNTINTWLPVTVIGISNAVAVSAGRAQTCAVLADGTVQCWGENFGSTPITVSGISTAVGVSVGSGVSCAVLTDGTVRCWGHNFFGQLGGTGAQNLVTPVTVNGISNAVAVSSGGQHDVYSSGHSCAQLTDGTLKCWGSNTNGQLGNGSAFSHIPTSTLGYLPLTWTTSNPNVASVNKVGKTQALASGTTLITTNLNGLSASTLVTVPSALVLDGFWPGTATAGQFVFIFGQGFVPQQTKVLINGIPVSFVQVADPTLLFLMLPSGNTRGPITITTPSGSVTSALSFNVPLKGVKITGLWPSIVSPGQLVFVFGSGFVTNATTATVNSLPAPVLQVLDPTLLFFMAPSTPTTGFVTVTTSAGTATSASLLTIK